MDVAEDIDQLSEEVIECFWMVLVLERSQCRGLYAVSVVLVGDLIFMGDGQGIVQPVFLLQVNLYFPIHVDEEGWAHFATHVADERVEL